MRCRLLVSALCCLLAFTGASTAIQASPLVDSYRRALLLDPDNFSFHCHLGLTLLLAGENQQAIAHLSRAYPNYPESLDLHFNLGIAYLRTGDLDSALLNYERAEELGTFAHPTEDRSKPRHYIRFPSRARASQLVSSASTACKSINRIQQQGASFGDYRHQGDERHSSWGSGNLAVS